MRDEEPRFRITVRVWEPTTPVVVPMRPGHLDGPDVVYEPLLDGTIRLGPLPSELVIRELLELDTADPDSVLAFINRYGMVDLAQAHEVEWELDAARAPLAELQNSLTILQLLARHFVTDALGGDLTELWNNTTRSHGDETGFYSVEDDVQCQQLFNQWFREMLRHAHAHPDVHFVTSDLESQWGYPEHDLIDALTLQLCALLHAKLPVCTCAFEGCRRPFLRQRDTAEQGQYRKTGVKYCTRLCAKAQAQRENRRRKQVNREQ